MVVEQNVGQQDECREHREGEDDHRSLHAAEAEFADIGVGSSRCKAAEDGDQRREGRNACARLGDKRCADESKQDAEPLDSVWSLLQDEDRHQNGKKGRELVQDIGVSDPHVVYSPEIAEDAHCADAAAQEHIHQACAGNIELFSRAHKNEGCEEGGDNVSEESFLHGRHIAGEPHEDGHQREEKGGRQNEQDSLCAVGGGSRRSTCGGFFIGCFRLHIFASSKYRSGCLQCFVSTQL